MRVDIPLKPYYAHGKEQPDGSAFNLKNMGAILPANGKASVLINLLDGQYNNVVLQALTTENIELEFSYTCNKDIYIESLKTNNDDQCWFKDTTNGKVIIAKDFPFYKELKKFPICSQLRVDIVNTSSEEVEYQLTFLFV